jgi:hypothetical protein
LASPTSEQRDVKQISPQVAMQERAHQFNIAAPIGFGIGVGGVEPEGWIKSFHHADALGNLGRLRSIVESEYMETYRSGYGRS